MVQRCFPSCSHGSRVIYVLAEVCAEIYSGNNHIRPLRQKLMQRHNDAVGWRSVDGPLALRDGVTHDRLTQRQRLGRAALFAAWRDDADRGEALQLRSQRAQSRRFIAVIVSQKYVRHGRERFVLRTKSASTTRIRDF